MQYKEPSPVSNPETSQGFITFQCTVLLSCPRDTRLSDHVRLIPTHHMTESQISIWSNCLSSKKIMHGVIIIDIQCLFMLDCISRNSEEYQTRIYVCGS